LPKNFIKKLTEKQIHALLEKTKITHRFNLSITRKNKEKEIKIKNISILFHHESSGWSVTHIFPITKKRDNVSKFWNTSLIHKGKYKITIKMSTDMHSNETIIFDFENDYDSLKNVMKDLEKTIKFIKKTTSSKSFLESIKTKRILQKIKFIKELVPWITFLREGEKQETFEKKAEILRENILKAEQEMKSLSSKDFIQRLKKIEASCKNCHDIFREDDKEEKRIN